MATSITNTSVTTDDLTVDTSTLKVDATNNRVGIGTATPTQDLTIVNSGSARMELVSGTSGTSIIDMGDSADKDIGGIRYAQGTDTMQFRTGNDVRMTINSNGYVTMPNQPCFSMGTTNNSGQGVANSDIILNTGLNQGNHVNTSSGIFTAPVAGRYIFTAWSIKNNINGSVARLQIMKNGSVIAEARMDESGSYTQAHCTVIENLAANDQIKFRNGDSGSFYMGGYYGECSGYLLG